VKSYRERDKGLPRTEIYNKGKTRERLSRENINDYIKEEKYYEKYNNYS
jgi:hypothetical protein